MAFEAEFGVFKDDGKGPMWRKSFAELDKSKLNAQEWADSERTEFFVYSFRTYTEVARCFPSKTDRQTKAPRVPTQPPAKDG